MPDLIDAMQSVLAEFSTGATQQPLRTVLQIGEAKSFFGVMPGYVPTLNAMGTKLVTVFESNPARGLPSHLATIVLLDPSTGALRAIVDRYHGSADRRGVRGRGASAGARGRQRPRADWIRRPGAKPPAGPRPR
jgi:ornithine cyclodeaminase/alanine dehydrogenase-like protein (mu-crystallin family)